MRSKTSQIAVLGLLAFSGTLASTALAQSQSAARPADLATTVEALLAVDAKAALDARKQVSPVKVAAPGRATEKVEDGPGNVVVEFILGQGAELTAGLIVDGAPLQVRRGSEVAGGYRVSSIEGGCVLAIKPHKAKPAPAPQQHARRKSKGIDKTKSDLWPKILGVGKSWCFKEKDASEMAAPAPSERSTFSNQTGLPMLLPKGSPLPPSGGR